MKVVVTGATGFIGRALVRALAARGDEVRALSREPRRAEAVASGVKGFAWDALTGPPPDAAISGADAVVSLAGEGIGDARWSEDRKRRIRDSRVLGTRNLVAAIERSSPRPRALVSGSAIGYYGARPAGPVDESSPPGDDFLAVLCRDWETEAAAAERLGLRVVLLRTGVVLGKEGGALKQMLLPFRLGLGGRIGDGRQWMSWVQLQDEVGLLLHALDRTGLRGPVNAVAPSPATNAEFTRALGAALRRPTVFPAPPLALKLRFGRELVEAVILSSQRVEPKAALASGYSFRHPNLASALRASVA